MWLRKFLEEHVIPDARLHEEDGKFPSPRTVELQACVPLVTLLKDSPKGIIYDVLMVNYRKYNLLAMRMGPGKHLKGLTLADGLVKPEEVRFFSQWYYE